MMLQAGPIVIDADTVNSLIYPTIVGLVVLCVGWWLDHKSKKRTDDLADRVDSTRYEITNEHKQPLRNDLDSKFDIVFAKLNNILSTQKRHDRLFHKQAETIIAIREDVAELTDGQAQHTDDIESLRHELDSTSRRADVQGGIQDAIDLVDDNPGLDEPTE